MFKRIVSVSLSTFLVLGCGGGGGGSMTPTKPAVVPPVTPAAIPQQAITHSKQAPVWSLGNTTNIGARLLPELSQLRKLNESRGFSISAGMLRDGVAANDVLDYTRTMAAGEAGLVPFLSPPTIRIATGTKPEFIDYAVRAVQVINAHLPYDKRLRFSTLQAPPRTHIDDIPEGEIYIDFAPQALWSDSVKMPGRAGESISTNYLPRSYGKRNGHIWIDSDVISERGWTADHIVHVMVHELLHSIGFGGHVDAARFPLSAMTERVPKEAFPWILGKVDTDALLAMYTRFVPGVSPNDISPHTLGPWSDETAHLTGAAGFGRGRGAMIFGVSTRNGFTRPWATGRTPATALAKNPELRETVVWNGMIFGVNNLLRGVDGDARLAVDLGTLNGQLDFTNLVSILGQGRSAVWNDGDLRYSVSVRGNTFTQTGGDAGEVTGAFFGPSHEGMGGVLERSDLSGAFGGKR